MKIATKKNSRSSVLHLHLKGPIEPLDKGYLWPTLESQRGRYRANKRPVAETKEVPKCQPINLVLSQRNNQPNNPYAKSRGDHCWRYKQSGHRSNNCINRQRQINLA